MKFVYRAIKGEFEQALKEKYQPLAQAGQETIQEVANQVKLKGRSHIARAGFSKLWQNALRADVYPKRKVSLNAATLIWHKIPYADVFETGATIRGKPRLWLPLSSTPRKVGRNRLTAERFTREIGRLRFVQPPGRKPLLFANMAVSEGQAKSGNYGKVTLAKLRKGASGSGIVRAVPVFVGVDSVKLRDRFQLSELIEREADKMAGIFAEKLEAKDV